MYCAMAATREACGTHPPRLLETRETQMREVRVGVLYDQLPQGLAATLINAFVLAIIQAPIAGETQTWLWFSAMVAVCAARYCLLVVRRGCEQRDRNPALWANWFFAGVLTTACFWGATAFVLYPKGDIIHQAFIGFVLAGMTAGAMGSFAASHRMFLAFMLPTCLPYALMNLVQGNGMSVAMGVMTLAFILTTYVTSKKTNASTSEALRLRFENLELVEQLGDANRLLQKEVDERQRAESTMRELVDQVTGATNAKSNFLANMSHEIRTPMNGVIGMADILSRSQLDRRQRHQVSLIQNAARTLLTLLNDILDFSRIEAGHVELECTSFDLREMVGDAVEVLAEQAENKNIDLAYDISPSVSPFVIGDQTRLRQVLINLVGNAIKFTRHGAVIVRISSLPNGADGDQMVHFRVRDSGIGIDPSVRSSLFEPFKQADASVTRRFGGTGLGLSISSHLVELMGGKLDCESRLGEGSEFFFSVPLSVDRDAIEKMTSTHAGFHSARVLVVDDNPVTTEIIANYLASWRVTAVHCAGGGEALHVLAEAARSGTPFAAAIASATLPDMSGIELATRMQHSTDIRETKVILLTPMQWAPDLQRAEPRNIARSVHKPVRQSQLFDALSYALVATGRGSNADLSTRLAPGQTIEPQPRFDCYALLVEDNPVNQEVAAHYLKSFGCRLDIADSGTAALVETGRNVYDIIFMDCQMPDMDGFTTTRRLREHALANGQARVPVVALTASAFAGDREQCLAAGMDDYISKPFAPRDLELMISKWVASPSDHTGTPLAIGEPSDIVFGEAASEDQRACLDRQQLLELYQRSPDLLGRLIALYSEHAPPLLEKIETAAADGDFCALKAAAHALKSSSSNMAAIRMAELCQVIEVHAQKNDIDTARLDVVEMKAEFKLVTAALQEATMFGDFEACSTVAAE